MTPTLTPEQALVDTVARMLGGREMMTADEWLNDGQGAAKIADIDPEHPAVKKLAHDNFAAYSLHRERHREKAREIIDTIRQALGNGKPEVSEGWQELLHYEFRSLLFFAAEAQAGRQPSDGREFYRRIGFAYDKINAAIPSTSPTKPDVSGSGEVSKAYQLADGVRIALERLLTDENRSEFDRKLFEAARDDMMFVASTLSRPTSGDGEAVAWQHRTRSMPTIPWGPWKEGVASTTYFESIGLEYEERALYDRPQPSEAVTLPTREEVEAIVLEKLTDKFGPSCFSPDEFPTDRSFAGEIANAVLAALGRR